ncbi:unnamed protein product, partial [Rotaria sp. Silwood2]
IIVYENDFKIYLEYPSSFIGTSRKEIYQINPSKLN